ncbi:MAG TPA: DUF3108 domain-containing protein [Terriglobia bacterium]|nr:DUF3108 domain-containing protein [Terriglobia bacterium]
MMNFRLLKFSFLLVPLLVSGGPPPTGQAAVVPFGPGERLVYSVSWSVFPAGQVTAAVTKVAGNNGQDALQILTTAHSRGFVSLIYDLNDQFRSMVDPRTLCSRQISKQINEGRRHKQTQITFDSTRRVAILDEKDLTKPGDPAKHTENAIPACVEDIVTGFYYLRHQPMHVGSQIHVPVNDGSETHDVIVEVQAREPIDTALGKRFAFRVEPRVFGNLYKKKGRMLIWFSDDAQRLPLRIRAELLVGDIVGNLQSVSAPGSIEAAPGNAPPGSG